jgi:autophagy-related protein 27
VLNGGLYNKQRQRAVIDMQCDPDRTGNEKPPVKAPDEGKARATEDKGDDDDDRKTEPTPNKDDPNSLRYVSYRVSEDDPKMKSLHLDWRTKYACEDFEEDDDEGKDRSGKHWGFFTWLIIV